MNGAFLTALERDKWEDWVNTRKRSYTHLRADESALKCEDCVYCETPESYLGENRDKLGWCRVNEDFVSLDHRIDEWCDFDTAEIKEE